MIGARYFSGSPFEEMAGYARAVIDGDMIYVSGTTGFAADTCCSASTSVRARLAASSAARSVVMLQFALSPSWLEFKFLIIVTTCTQEPALVEWQIAK